MTATVREDERWARTFRSLPDHLESVALAHADRIAVETRDAVLTHAQLHADADKVAGVLHRALADGTVDHAHRVAVLVEHGAASLVAALGVLKTGAAAVLLDPAWPDEHLEWAISTCEPTVLITSAALRPVAERLANRLCLITPDCWVGAAPWRRGQPIAADSPAFILTTSGSTGRPKAVVERHQNVVHEALRLEASMGLSPQDRQTVLRANCAGAISDTYSALLAGARVLPFDPLGETYDSFQRWLSDYQPTVWRSAPSLFRTLFADIITPTLRVVFLCGEPSYGSDLEVFRRATNPACVLINCYGTTETATATVAVYPHDCAAVDGALSIGKPVEDVDITLLGDDGAVIDGEGIGQLVVWSPYLSAGYLGGQAEANARFGIDVAGHRYYQTGDAGQRLADGTMLCISRIGADETGRLAVSADRHRSTDRFIGDNGQLTWNGKSALSGKVDRKALLAMDSGWPELEKVYVAARTTTEELLVNIWEEVLGVERVGIHDEFFELGGHSLLAIQVLSRLRNAVGIELPVRALFEVPTVADLARQIDTISRAVKTVKDVPSTSASDREEIEL